MRAGRRFEEFGELQRIAANSLNGRQQKAFEREVWKAAQKATRFEKVMKLRLRNESRKLRTADRPIIAILGVGGEAVALKSEQNAVENQ